jgi:acyl-CoA thioesterase I
MRVSNVKLTRRVYGGARAFAFALLAVLAVDCAQAADIVCLGASNTYGYGVSPGEDFPSQLQALLHAKGLNVSVANQGINGDSTAGMLARLDGVLSPDTKVMTLQVGLNGNEQRAALSAKDTEANVDAITKRARSKGVKVILVTSTMMGVSGGHMTAAQHHALAAKLLPIVISALRR